MFDMQREIRKFPRRIRWPRKTIFFQPLVATQNSPGTAGFEGVDLSVTLWHCQEKAVPPLVDWLVVHLPLRKIWVRQLGWWNSQLEKQASHVPGKPPTSRWFTFVLGSQHDIKISAILIRWDPMVSSNLLTVFLVDHYQKSKIYAVFWGVHKRHGPLHLYTVLNLFFMNDIQENSREPCLTITNITKSFHHFCFMNVFQ